MEYRRDHVWGILGGGGLVGEGTVERGAGQQQQQQQGRRRGEEGAIVRKAFVEEVPQNYNVQAGPFSFPSSHAYDEDKYDHRTDHGPKGPFLPDIVQRESTSRQHYRHRSYDEEGYRHSQQLQHQEPQHQSHLSAWAAGVEDRLRECENVMTRVVPELARRVREHGGFAEPLERLEHEFERLGSRVVRVQRDGEKALEDLAHMLQRSLEQGDRERTRSDERTAERDHSLAGAMQSWMRGVEAGVSALREELDTERSDRVAQLEAVAASLTQCERQAAAMQADVEAAVRAARSSVQTMVEEEVQEVRAGVRRRVAGVESEARDLARCADGGLRALTEALGAERMARERRELRLRQQVNDALASARSMMAGLRDAHVRDTARLQDVVRMEITARLRAVEGIEELAVQAARRDTATTQARVDALVQGAQHTQQVLAEQLQEHKAASQQLQTNLQADLAGCTCDQVLEELVSEQCVSARVDRVLAGVQDANDDGEEYFKDINVNNSVRRALWMDLQEQIDELKTYITLRDQEEREEDEVSHKDHPEQQDHNPDTARTIGQETFSSIIETVQRIENDVSEAIEAINEDHAELVHALGRMQELEGVVEELEAEGRGRRERDDRIEEEVVAIGTEMDEMRVEVQGQLDAALTELRDGVVEVASQAAAGAHDEVLKRLEVLEREVDAVAHEHVQAMRNQEQRITEEASEGYSLAAKAHEAVYALRTHLEQQQADSLLDRELHLVELEACQDECQQLKGQLGQVVLHAKKTAQNSEQSQQTVTRQLANSANNHSTLANCVSLHVTETATFKESVGSQLVAMTAQQADVTCMVKDAIRQQSELQESVKSQLVDGAREQQVWTDSVKSQLAENLQLKELVGNQLAAMSTQQEDLTRTVMDAAKAGRDARIALEERAITSLKTVHSEVAAMKQDVVMWRNERKKAQASVMDLTHHMEAIEIDLLLHEEVTALQLEEGGSSATKQQITALQAVINRTISDVNSNVSGIHARLQQLQTGSIQAATGVDSKLSAIAANVAEVDDRVSECQLIARQSKLAVRGLEKQLDKTEVKLCELAETCSSDALLDRELILAEVAIKSESASAMQLEQPVAQLMAMTNELMMSLDEEVEARIALERNVRGALIAMHRDVQESCATQIADAVSKWTISHEAAAPA